jgi:hypothetical protein
MFSIILSNEWVAGVYVWHRRDEEKKKYLFIYLIRTTVANSLLPHHRLLLGIVNGICPRSSGLENYWRKKRRIFFKARKKKEICLFMGQLSVICYSSDRTCHSTLPVSNGKVLFLLYPKEKKKKMMNLNIDKKLHSCTLTSIIKGNLNMYAV